MPPFVPHQEINASPSEPLTCVVVRSDQEPIVVNLAIPTVETPEEVLWVDLTHPAPKSRSAMQRKRGIKLLDEREGQPALVKWLSGRDKLKLFLNKGDAVRRMQGKPNICRPR